MSREELKLHVQALLTNRSEKINAAALVEALHLIIDELPERKN